MGDSTVDGKFGGMSDENQKGIEMIDIKELRAAVETIGVMAVSTREVSELLDRLEAAEKERDNANAAAAGVALHAGAMQARLEAAEKAVTEAYRRGYETGQEEIAAELEFAKREGAA